jgi:hypothetical protein
VSRREAWLSAGAVFALALVVRAVVAAAIRFPVPEDTAYYAGVARIGALPLLIVRQWPGILDRGGPASACFEGVPLTDNFGREPAEGSSLAQIRVFRIVCP